MPPIDLSQFDGLDPDGGVDFFVQLNKALLGESADLDGDGMNDYIVYRRPDGTEVDTYEVGYGVPAFMRERFPDGHVRIRFWHFNFAQPTQIEDTYPDGSRVTLFDEDLDLKLERRRTETMLDADTVEGVDEVDAGSVWVEARRWQRPAAMDQGPGRCNGATDFPLDPSHEIDNINQTSSPFFAGDATVACLKMDRERITQGLDCARKRLTCLDDMNPEQANRVRAALTGEQLAYGCSNPCAGKYATTLKPGGAIARTNFNRDLLRSQSDDEVCTSVMHELMHFANVPMDEQHDNGIDAVYSCARFCNRCTHIGPKQPPPSPNQDCARCASDPVVRRTCGVKRTQETSALCPTSAICHGTIGTNLACSSCENIVDKDCADGRLGEPYFNCCTSCPANAQRINDRMCPGPIQASDSCSMPPARCSP